MAGIQGTRNNDPRSGQPIIRTIYALGIMVGTSLAITLKIKGYEWISPPRSDITLCGSLCWGYLAVYRIALAMALYHLSLGLLLIGLGNDVDDDTDTDDFRWILQNRLWPLKLLIWIGWIVGCFYISDSVMVKFWIPYCKLPVLRRFTEFENLPSMIVVFTGIFLIIQCLFLVDGTRDVSEVCVARYERTQSWEWATLLIGLTCAAYALILYGSSYLYMTYESTEVKVFVSINLVLTVLINILSVLPKVQKANPKTGLLPASILSLYNTYLVLSAFINASSSPSSVAMQVFGLVLLIFTLGYMAGSFSATPLVFHWMCALVSVYMACILTNVRGLCCIVVDLVVN